MTSNSKFRVAVVDDHELVREGLVSILENIPGLQVCACAGTFSEALEVAQTHKPDLMLVDLNLAGADGLDLVKAIKTLVPVMHLIVVSIRDETLYAERALKAGAAGYLMKSAPAEEFVAAVNTVMGGNVYLSQKQNQRMIKNMVIGGEIGSEIQNLTDRELHVYQLLGAGKSMRNIAKILGISIRTAESHRDNIKNKLGLDSAQALNRHAVQWMESQHYDQQPDA